MNSNSSVPLIASPNKYIKEGSQRPEGQPGHGEALDSSPPLQQPRGRRAFTSDDQQLFVGNIPEDCTEEHLEELFSKFGQVMDVRIYQMQGRQSLEQASGSKAQGFVSSGFSLLY